MEELLNKIQELRNLVKAALPKSTGPKVPALPKISSPATPSMTAGNKPAKIPGMNPDSKKDPKKIAEQIKDGTIKRPALIKAYANGQWKIDEQE